MYKRQIKRIGVQFMKEPEHVKIAAKELTTELVDQYYIRVKEQEKFDTMTRLMDVEQPELAIVFGRTKRRVDELTRGLKIRGFRAEGIHGDLDQNKRLRVLRDFKNGNLDVLVATDVAARGLDISGVTHVLSLIHILSDGSPSQDVCNHNFHKYRHPNWHRYCAHI